MAHKEGGSTGLIKVDIPPVVHTQKRTVARYVHSSRGLLAGAGRTLVVREIFGGNEPVYPIERRLTRGMVGVGCLWVCGYMGPAYPARAAARPPLLGDPCVLASRGNSR